MGERFKFECVCGQHLVAQRRLAGTKLHCPSCLKELTVPAAGETLDDAGYRKTLRHSVFCSCGYKLLVKPEAAGQRLNCPMCQAVILVPQLDILRKQTTSALEGKTPARDRMHTEDLLLLIDDDEGPGAEVS